MFNHPKITPCNIKVNPKQLGLALLLMCSAVLNASDWPAYRNDLERSSVTKESILFPLQPAWIYRSAQPPHPAWSEPGRAMNALDFDYAFQPVISNGIVYLGSSADDTLRASDLATGKEIWSLTVGGAIRFAPQIYEDKCYFAADDGVLYCVNAKSGKRIWQFRGGIDNRRFIAQGKMASRWPCRSGVLVKNGVVYTIAGMWPSEGVFVFALDAITGKEIWCNDTSSYDYTEYPHAPSASFGGPAPQGYLLTAKDLLIVPTGRSSPATFDLKTGRLIHWNADAGNRGGTNATVFGDSLFISAVAWQPDESPRLGESTPHRTDSVAVFALNDFKETWPYSKSVLEFNDELKLPKWRSQITQGIFGRQRVLFSGKRIYTSGNDKADAFEFSDANTVKRMWTTNHERAYSEALTENAVLLGCVGKIDALSVSDGKLLWSASVDGQVRGLAIADGRIVATTSLGTVYCFDSKAVQTKDTTSIIPSPQKLSAELEANVSSVLSHVPNTDSALGFALVVGEKDSDLARTIVERTKLNVLCLLPNETAVEAERSKLISQTAWYGTRLTVYATDKVEGKHAIPFVSTFANLVVVGADANEFESNELYRVLRPCGGLLCYLNNAKPILDASIPKEEIKDDGKNLIIVRGKLPGAFDWDSKIEADERVRWPLEFQWFGDPGPQLVQSRHSRPRTPFAANGRMFTFGEYHLTAIDGYNGVNLWRRRFSKTICSGTNVVSANDNSVFVNAGKAIAEFDAQSGRFLKLYTNDEAYGPPILDGSKPIHVTTEARQGTSAEMDIDGASDALNIVLTTKTHGTSVDDIWELTFDLRKPEQRLNAPGYGTFEAIVNTWPGTLRPHVTFEHPPISVSRKKPEIDGVSQVEISIKWSDIEKFYGWRPTSFSLAADVKVSTEDYRIKLWSKPLARAKDYLNDGEAIISFRQESPASNGRRILSPILPVEIAELQTAPAVAKQEARTPLMIHHRIDDENNSDFKEGLRLSQEQAEQQSDKNLLKRAKGFELLTRQQPFSAEDGAREYTRSYGCSGTSTSATMDFFRSGTIGMYDRAEDSGMRNLSGIRSGCGLTLLAAEGMLLYSESASDCLCSYSFNTSLGLAPALKRRNEDWALFDDKNLTATQIKQSALNFGAPGDRRDENGILWLTYPRPSVALVKRNTMQLPYHMELAPGFGMQHINVERHPILNTDRPWIYGSQVKGITRLQMDLVYHQPQKLLIATPAGRAPEIDGNLNDRCWDGFAALPCPDRNANYFLRYDKDNLYIGYDQSQTAKSKSSNSKTKNSNSDVDFEKDNNHMRVSLRNKKGLSIATFALTSDDNRYDAKMDLRAVVPKLEINKSDGKPSIWKDQGTQIKLDGGAMLQVGWNEDSLQLLCSMPQNYDASGSQLKSFALLLMQPGSNSSEQLVIDAKAGTVHTNSYRENNLGPSNMKIASAVEKQSFIVEASIPFTNLSIKPEKGATLALLARVFDPSHTFFKSATSVPWANKSQRRDLDKMDHVLFLGLGAEKEKVSIETEKRRGDAGYPYYDYIRILKDDAAWSGDWTGKIKSADNRVMGELCIPWKTLESAGIKQENLEVEVQRPTRWSGTQDVVLTGFERTATDVYSLNASPTSSTFTVRLHFAELDEVAPGERVFDISIQGKTVLKDFDVVREAGGRNKALVREFKGISADSLMDIRFTPKSTAPDSKSAPVLNGLELLKE